MPRWLHADFSDSEEAYARAESYWAGLWRGVARRAGVTHLWQAPWRRNPIRDGNPIFTAVCPALGRAVRIIQEPIGDPGDVDLDSWLDYAGDRGNPDTVRELVIACCPSEENIPEVEDLLRQWLTSGRIVHGCPGYSDPVRELSSGGLPVAMMMRATG